MIKIKISDIIDRVLLFLVTAFFAIAIAGYFSREPMVIFSAGIAAALAVTALLGILKNRRVPEVTAAQIDETMLQFFLMGESACFDAVFNALGTRYEPQKRDGYIAVNRTAVFVRFSPAPLSFSEFCRIYAEHKTADTKRILILTAAGADARSVKTAPLVPGPTVSILNGATVYRLLKRLNGLPENNIRLKRDKRSFKRFFAHALSPKNSKRYLFAAFILIGSSFFMPSSVYYIAVGAVCLLLAILSKLDVLSRIKARP